MAKKKVDAASNAKPVSKAPASKAKAAPRAKAAKPKTAKAAKVTDGGADGVGIAKTTVDAEKSTAKKAPAAKPPAAKPLFDKRAFSTEEIGHVAGDVWRVLSENGTQTAAELTKAVGAPAELVAAALGWLAREDKLAFEMNGRSVLVSLL